MTPIQIMQKRHELQLNPIPWPVKRYSTIVVDPPWPMEKILLRGRPNQFGFDYSTMTINEIKALRVPEILHDNSFVFLWTTQKFLPWAFEILSHWDCKYRFTMTWYKNGGFQPFNCPQFNAEFVLVGAKGNPKLC